MYNKFWEWNNGNKSWVEITAERFDRTINPAVFIPDGRYQDLKMRNLPNIQIEKDAWSYYSVTKTFPCGRKYTWKERNLLGLISDSFKFANFEDIEFHRLREEKEQLEKRYNELLKRLDQLSNEIDIKNNEIGKMITSSLKLAEDINKVLEINEKGGQGSRKAVKELLSKWVEYAEDEDGSQFLTIKY